MPTSRASYQGTSRRFPRRCPAHWVIQFGFLLGPDTDLHAANLSGDNLSGFDLAGAFGVLSNLTNANLAGTDLSTSNLSGVISGGVIGTPTPTLPSDWR